MLDTTADALKKMHLFAPARYLYRFGMRLHGRLFPYLYMKSPTYGAELHRKIVQGVDYVRYATIALAIKTTQTHNIAGSYAEVGVYRGKTSKFIHDLAPERKLHLFDTFEGFPVEYIESSVGASRFKDTDIDIIRSLVGNTQNVLIHKGVFPGTTEGLKDEQYAFVMLDLDLYSPMLSGLQYFYPRMAPGGYIFVHDYNNPGESKAGSFRAVNEFMRDKPEQLIEIADLYGTAIIRINAAGPAGANMLPDGAAPSQ